MARAPDPSTNRRFATCRTIAALILRDMSATYGRSPGGYVWMVLEPVLGITLLTAIFSAGFRSPALGTNFAIFYATGLVPFLMYSTISSAVANAVRTSRPLLAYPGVTFFDTLAAKLLLTTLTQALVSLIVITAIRSIYVTQTVIEFGTILTGYTMLIGFAAAVGLLNGFLFMKYELWGRVWSIISRPLVFISGVIFLYENMPEPYRGWLWWNPLVHCIGKIRSGFYIHYDALYASPIYVFIVTGLVGLTGMLFLSRHYRELLEI
ncbi:sugar ABC transporter permease [Marinibacterium profundimaris]|uniref:Transport permease protein n=1 Tax=Marinibacterium profundimaris TaxID=1679460 RepID=A0A225NBW8_9RHOB|nr:sugar ABC transporter permease [Marinibacterium profundimaris]